MILRDEPSNSLYSYDRSNRLTNSQYSGVGTENYSVSNSYDANGNILTLQRYSKTGANTFGLVDNLTYSYLSNGNKLQKVDDSISGNTLANDFRDVAGNDYAFSVDGKLTKDNNKSIFNIKYNFLDLVSKVTFNDSTKVEYFYTSMGERRQRKVTKNGVTSYTLYDGEMVYQFTGNVTSLNDYKVSEIQNSEGRFLNGKLEYGYTDHVGNLRLSYKDSLGVAFITQSQSYDPWSNVNSGSEYQLSGIQGDRYLVSGKENDNITGNTLLDWRDYDSVTGRMNSFDPDATEGGQISLSPFAYSWNRPSMLNDPDGRCPVCIGFMIGMFSSAIGNMASGKMPSNIGQFLLPGVQGAIGGGVASAIGGAFAGVGSFAGKGLLQAGTHALSGGLQSAAFGGNFWQGAASSGISSGFASGSDALGLGGVGQLLGGGLSGGVTAELFGGSFWDGARDGLIVSGLNHLSHGGGENGGELAPNPTVQRNLIAPEQGIRGIQTDYTIESMVIPLLRPVGWMFSKGLTTANGFLLKGFTVKTPFNITVQRFGNMSLDRSDFWGLKIGTNKFINRTFAAIKPSWNPLTQYTTGVIPKGTAVQFGVIGPQGLKYPGGSLQFIVPSRKIINQSSKIISQ